MFVDAVIAGVVGDVSGVAKTVVAIDIKQENRRIK